MPLFSGIATHDNTKHVGSAKAGVPGGVAQLDDGGNLSLIESEIIIPRSDIGDISFIDKLSEESFLSFMRAGSNDWSARVLENGSPYDLLSSYWYNRPNGIAQLDIDGNLSLIESEIIIPRSDIGDISFRDKLSDEKFLSFIRAGSNDWSASVLEKGSPYDLLSSYWYNRPNGIPQLSSERRIETAHLPFIIEEYTNHSGTLDNFTIKNTAGSGSVSEDSLTHSIKISSGDTSYSRGGIELGDSLPNDENVNVLSCKVRDYNTIPNSYNCGHIGFSSDPNNYKASCTIVFEYTTEGSWIVFLRDKDANMSTVQVSVAKGDILTVELYNKSAVLYINGDQVYATSSNAFEGNMTPCIMAYAPSPNPPASVTMYVDAISLKRYKGR